MKVEDKNKLLYFFSPWVYEATSPYEAATVFDFTHWPLEQVDREQLPGSGRNLRFALWHLVIGVGGRF